jgi:hypothetical protein
MGKSYPGLWHKGARWPLVGNEILPIKIFPEKTTARESFSGPFGLVPAQTKKKKNWDNFLPKGRPWTSPKGRWKYWQYIAIISNIT